MEGYRRAGKRYLKISSTVLSVELCVDRADRPVA
jgi:hypothetical protein